MPDIRQNFCKIMLIECWDLCEMSSKEYLAKYLKQYI